MHKDTHMTGSSLTQTLEAFLTSANFYSKAHISASDKKKT